MAVSLLQWGARPGGGGPRSAWPGHAHVSPELWRWSKGSLLPRRGGQMWGSGQPGPCARVPVGGLSRAPPWAHRVWWPPGRNPLKTLFLCLGNRISQLVHTTLQTRAPEAALWPLRQSVRLPHQGSCASALGGGASDFGGTRATSLVPQELGNEPFGTLKCKRGDRGQTGGFLETSTGDVFSGPLVRTRQPSLGGDGVAEKWADGSNACL